MYQALYRKWRPQIFDDVIGQEHITEALKSQISTGHLSHAYIFIGTRGTGKTTCARILAKAVNCEHPVNGNPCCACPACLSIAEGTATDIVELDAASNNGVENVRALRDEAVYSPAVLKKRVYIIDEVHMLSTSAFNALLKILEEPPEHLMFILATTELQKVPATILSRCQRHSFRRIPAKPLSAYLETIASREQIRLSPEAAELIAGLAEGGVRDSLSMLDQCSTYESVGVEEVYASVGLAGNRRIQELFELLCAHKTEQAVRFFNELWLDGKDPASLLRELSTLARDILMVKIAPQGSADLVAGGYDRARLRRYAAEHTVEELSGMLETLQAALGNMRERLSPKITAELCLVTLCTEIAGDTLPGLEHRVAELEEAVKRGVPVSASPQSAPEPEPKAEPKPEPEPEPEPEEPEPLQEEPEPLPEEPEPLPKEPELLPAEPKSAKPAELGAEVWKAIVARVQPKIGMELRRILNDPNNVFGSIEGDVLIVEANGFYLGRLGQPKNLEIFAEEASALAGRPITARAREMKPKPAAGGGAKLSDLRQYDIVKFVD